MTHDVVISYSSKNKAIAATGKTAFFIRAAAGVEHGEANRSDCLSSIQSAKARTNLSNITITRRSARRGFA